MKTKQICTKHLISFSQSIDLQTKTVSLFNNRKNKKYLIDSYVVLDGSGSEFIRGILS